MANMRLSALLNVGILLIASRMSLADLFIGPSTENNRIVVAENEAIIISGVFTINGSSAGWGFISDGRTNSPSYPLSSLADKVPLTLAGAIELFLNGTDAISFQKLTNTATRSLVIKEGASYTIDVPSDKRLKLLGHVPQFGFGGGPEPALFSVTLLRGGAETGPYYALPAKAELDGPLQIRFNGTDNSSGIPNSLFLFPLQYYLTDNATILSSDLAIVAPTGTFNITVERSFDLKTWFSSILIPASTDAKSFYRLRIDN